jgi:UDP:flavonoid glycosyltransferase YjiC (YdhE family)
MALRVKIYKMSKYLFTTLPSDDLGLLTRSLPIARELSSRGHGVSFSSVGKAPGRLIAEAGFENLAPHHPIYEILEMGSDFGGLLRCLGSRDITGRYGGFVPFIWKTLSSLPVKNAPATPEVWNMGQVGAQMGMLNGGFIRSNIEAYLDVVRRSGADAVVDFWNPFAAIAARIARKPLITVTQADAHPAGKGFIWWKPQPPDIPTPVPAFNREMARFGLPPIKKFEDLSVGDITLVVGMPETDPLAAQADVTYIGSVLWQKENEQLPDWIAGRKKDRPLIWLYSGNPRYFSGNTSFDSLIVIQACAAALAGMAADVILTTGHHELPKEVLPLPANFRHEKFLPGLAMAECSDLLIHHGGYGSCQTGLYTGTPAVILPTYSERESNARRVAAAGAGEVVAVETVSGKKTVNIGDLRSSVQRVLTDPAYRENARRVSGELRRYGGARQAAQLIEEFLTRAGNIETAGQRQASA